MTYAIEFCNVHFAVGNQIILSHIDQCIESQKITTLIGPSGAGKTTFLKLCNGLLSPTTGYIKVGQQMTESLDPTTLRRMVGIVLQQAPILRTTVYDNLALPHKLQSETLAEQEAVQMLEQVGLDASLLFYFQIDFQRKLKRTSMRLSSSSHSVGHQSKLYTNT